MKYEYADLSGPVMFSVFVWAQARVLLWSVDLQRVVDGWAICGGHASEKKEELKHL